MFHSKPVLLFTLVLAGLCAALAQADGLTLWANFIVQAAIPVPLILWSFAYLRNRRLGRSPVPGQELAPPSRLGSGWALLAAFVITSAIFLLWPNLDLIVSGWFWQGGHFIGASHLGQASRFIGYTLPFVVGAYFVCAYLARLFGRPLRLIPNAKDMAFLILTLTLGPGLIVNLGMKDHLHRPRPVQISEFGGGRVFRPLYHFDGECPKNCSFPSGETSEAIWLLAPASLVPSPWRAQAITVAIVFSAAVGLLRITFGGHFLSDTLIAALIIWALIKLLRWVIYRPQRARQI